MTRPKETGNEHNEARRKAEISGSASIARNKVAKSRAARQLENWLKPVEALLAGNGSLGIAIMSNGPHEKLHDALELTRGFENIRTATPDVSRGGLEQFAREKKADGLIIVPDLDPLGRTVRGPNHEDTREYLHELAMWSRSNPANAKRRIPQIMGIGVLASSEAGVIKGGSFPQTELGDGFMNEFNDHLLLTDRGDFIPYTIDLLPQANLQSGIAEKVKPEQKLRPFEP